MVRIALRATPKLSGNASSPCGGLIAGWVLETVTESLGERSLPYLEAATRLG